jgi:hypothetical protein
VPSPVLLIKAFPGREPPKRLGSPPSGKHPGNIAAEQTAEEDMVTRYGIPAEQLSDDELSRDLEHVYEKRYDMFRNGAADQFRNNVQRMAELEAEYLSRFPDKVVDADAKRRIGPEVRQPSG